MRRAVCECLHQLRLCSGSSVAASGSVTTSVTSAAGHQLQQAAAMRHLHRPHLHHAAAPHRHAPKPPRPRRSLGARLLAAAAKAVGLTLVAAPVSGVAALVVVAAASDEETTVVDVLVALPRTLHAVWWGVGSTYRYKALAAAHAGATDSEAYQRALAASHLTEAKRLLLLCQSNGGLYIKAGQLLHDMGRLPQEYKSALASLQDRVPPRPFQQIADSLVAELGCPLDQVFSEFNALSLAAASLAQVHRARLLDGRQVAVKVQYPGLEAAVHADLATMQALSRVAAWLFPASDFTWLTEELAKKLSYELDFRNEADNSERFATLMAGRADVAVPAVYRQWSGRRLLCMDWVDGCKVSDVDGLLARGLVPREVAVKLLDIFAQQQFETGFVHADPHAGNILVRAQPEDPGTGWLRRWWAGARPRPQLVLLDHGIYVTLPEELRRDYCQLWAAILLGDADTARQAAALVGGEKAARILPEILRPRDWNKVAKEERKRIVAESGIGSFQDFTQLLSEAPKPLLEVLRLGTVVRNTAAALGATIADRLRINATHAWRGMSRGDAERPDGQPLAYVGALSSPLQRWSVALRVAAMRLTFWLGSLLHDLTRRAIPGPPL